MQLRQRFLIIITSSIVTVPKWIEIQKHMSFFIHLSIVINPGNKPEGHFLHPIPRFHHIPPKQQLATILFPTIFIQSFFYHSTFHKTPTRNIRTIVGDYVVEKKWASVFISSSFSSFNLLSFPRPWKQHRKYTGNTRWQTDAAEVLRGRRYIMFRDRRL